MALIIIIISLFFAGLLHTTCVRKTSFQAGRFQYWARFTLKQKDTKTTWSNRLYETSFLTQARIFHPSRLHWLMTFKNIYYIIFYSPFIYFSCNCFPQTIPGSALEKKKCALCDLPINSQGYFTFPRVWKSSDRQSPVPFPLPSPFSSSFSLSLFIVRFAIWDPSVVAKGQLIHQPIFQQMRSQSFCITLLIWEEKTHFSGQASFLSSLTSSLILIHSFTISCNIPCHYSI